MPTDIWKGSSRSMPLSFIATERSVVTYHSKHNLCHLFCHIHLYLPSFWKVSPRTSDVSFLLLVSLSCVWQADSRLTQSLTTFPNAPLERCPQRASSPGLQLTSEAVRVPQPHISDGWAEKKNPSDGLFFASPSSKALADSQKINLSSAGVLPAAKMPHYLRFSGPPLTIQLTETENDKDEFPFLYLCSLNETAPCGKR